MRLVIATLGLSTAGGTETYVGTLAEGLQELGHEVAVHAPVVGEWGRELARRGLVVVDDERALPAGCDAALSQDAASAFRLAARYPGAPLVHMAHSHLFDVQSPPQLPGVVLAVVACSDVVARRVRALSHAPEVVRLRQPIDLRRFAPRGAVHPRGRRVLALGNYLADERLRMLADACADSGMEMVQAGSRWGEHVPDVALLINDADIVVGKARTVLEGMACGRAAYVYDWNGADGWVTPERYPALEADNFGGRLGSARADPARLREDLAAYRPEMGMANRDLVVAHHDAREHARKVVELVARLAPRASSPEGPLREMARLVDLHWRAELRATAMAEEAAAVRRYAHEMEVRLTSRAAELQEQLAAGQTELRAGSARAAAAEARLDEREARLADADRRAAEAAEAVAAARSEAEAARAAAEEARASASALTGTRRYRMAVLLARPLDRARARWRG